MAERRIEGTGKGKNSNKQDKNKLENKEKMRKGDKEAIEQEITKESKQTRWNRE